MKKMNKLTYTLLGLGFLTLLSGCGQGNGSNTGIKQVQNSTNGTNGNQHEIVDDFAELKSKLSANLKQGKLLQSTVPTSYTTNSVSDGFNWVNINGDRKLINNSSKVLAQITFSANTTLSSIDIMQNDHLAEGYISEILTKSSGSCFAKNSFSAGEVCYVQLVYTTNTVNIDNANVLVKINGESFGKDVSSILKITMTAQQLANQNIPYWDLSNETTSQSDWSDIGIVEWHPAFNDYFTNYPTYRPYEAALYMNIGSSSSIAGDGKSSLKFALSSANAKLGSKLYYPLGMGEYTCDTNQDITSGNSCGINISTTEVNFDDMNPFSNVYRLIVTPHSEFNNMAQSRRVLYSKGLLHTGNASTSFVGSDHFSIVQNISVAPYSDYAGGTPYHAVYPDINNLSTAKQIILSDALPSYIEALDKTNNTITRHYLLGDLAIPYKDFAACKEMSGQGFNLFDEMTCNNQKISYELNDDLGNYINKKDIESSAISSIVLKGIISVQYTDPFSSLSVNQPINIAKVDLLNPDNNAANFLRVNNITLDVGEAGADPSINIVPSTEEATDNKPIVPVGRLTVSSNGITYPARNILRGGKYKLSNGKIIMTNTMDWETNPNVNPIVSKDSQSMSSGWKIRGTGYDVKCGDINKVKQSLIDQGRDEIAETYTCKNYSSFVLIGIYPNASALPRPVLIDYNGPKSFNIWMSSLNFKVRADKYSNNSIVDNALVDSYDLNSNTYDGNVYDNSKFSWNDHSTSGIDLLLTP